MEEFLNPVARIVQKLFQKQCFSQIQKQLEVGAATRGPWSPSRGEHRSATQLVPELVGRDANHEVHRERENFPCHPPFFSSNDNIDKTTLTPSSVLISLALARLALLPASLLLRLQLH